MKIAMLTTVDNPYSPFDDWDEWYAWDKGMGYFTTEYLARIVVTSHDLPEYEVHQDIERAIDEIVEDNVLGLYRKVVKEVPTPKIAIV